VPVPTVAAEARRLRLLKTGKFFQSVVTLYLFVAGYMQSATALTDSHFASIDEHKDHIAGFKGIILSMKFPVELLH